MHPCLFYLDILTFTFHTSLFFPLLHLRFLSFSLFFLLFVSCLLAACRYYFPSPLALSSSTFPSMPPSLNQHPSLPQGLLYYKGWICILIHFFQCFRLDVVNMYQQWSNHSIRQRPGHRGACTCLCRRVCVWSPPLPLKKQLQTKSCVNEAEMCVCTF